MAILIGVLVAIVLLFILGWVLYRTVIFRIVDKDLFISILATYGLSILLQQLANAFFGANVRTAESGFGTFYLLGGAVTLSKIKLVSFFAALAVGAFLLLFLRQSRMGQAVSRANLQPGDLVFFYSPVSHVGIYIGNGQMVHAPTSGDVVKVASIDAVGGITAMRRIAG